MTTFTLLLSRSLLAMLLSLLFLLVGCKADFCDNVTCQNGGTCFEGGCNCPSGFTGARCEIELTPCLLKKCSEVGTDSCVVSTATGQARCLCTQGYEGDLCDSRWESKFVANYSSSEACDGDIGNYPLGILAGPDPQQITLVNFYNQQPDNLPAKVVANLLNASSFQIYPQFMAFGLVTGQGAFRSDGIIELSYEIIFNGDTTQCFVLLNPA